MMCTFQKNTYLYPRDTETPKCFPDISKPEIVGYFSVDRERCFIPDARNCKYVNRALFDRSRQLDLNEGYEKVVRKPEHATDEKLNHLLQFIVGNLAMLKTKDPEPSDRKILAVDIVCFRGLLRLLMCSPYEYKEGWSILATKYKGTIYLCALETDERKLRRQNETPENKRILSYGFKFEQYLMSDNPQEEPNTNDPVYEAEEFCCMFKTKLTGKRLLYGAEMDGIEKVERVDLNEADMNKLEFVELKVKLREEHKNQKINNLRFRLRNWWCQCFLANIKKIVVGTRSPAGIVDEMTELDVSSIPKLVQNFWSPAVCMKFCDDFLKLIDVEMKIVNCPYTVYKFDYDPNTRDSVKLTAFENKNALSFLPDWYVSALR